MKKNLTINELNASYYDRDMDQYTLEFFDGTLVDVDGKFFEGKEVDEYFFDEEENFNLAIEEGEIREK